MGKNRAAMINAVEQILQDTGNAIWTAAEIGAVIDDYALAEISAYVPYDVIETLTTTAGSKDLSLATITDLIRVKEVEFPISKEPKKMRNFVKRGTQLTMVIDFEPAASESVYIHCAKTHHLDADWTAGATYAVGNFVAPVTQNGNRYECSVAGVAHGSTEPTWPTTAGGTVVDNGTVVWTCRTEDSTTFDDPVLTATFTKLVAGHAISSKAIGKINTVAIGMPVQEYRQGGLELKAIALSELRAKVEPDMWVSLPRTR